MAEDLAYKTDKGGFDFIHIYRVRIKLSLQMRGLFRNYIESINIEVGLTGKIYFLGKGGLSKGERISDRF